MDKNKKEMIETLRELKSLLDDGILTQEEYDQQKAEVMEKYSAKKENPKPEPEAPKASAVEPAKEETPAVAVSPEPAVDNLSSIAEQSPEPIPTPEETASNADNTEVSTEEPKQDYEAGQHLKEEEPYDVNSSWFKRKKHPINTAGEGKKLIKETSIYFFIALGATVAFGLGMGLVRDLSWAFSIAFVICFAGAAYFGLFLWAMKMSQKRFENIHCSCGAELINDSNTTWVEKKRSSYTKKPSGKDNKFGTYITSVITVTCTCPACGKTKSFDMDAFIAGIETSDTETNAIVIRTQCIVDDYFAGHLHGKANHLPDPKKITASKCEPVLYSESIKGFCNAKVLSELAKTVHSKIKKEGKSGDELAGYNHYVTGDRSVKGGDYQERPFLIDRVIVIVESIVVGLAVVSIALSMLISAVSKNGGYRPGGTNGGGNLSGNDTSLSNNGGNTTGGNGAGQGSQANSSSQGSQANSSSQGNQWTYSIGSIFTFGKYEQDGKASNGKEDIEWIVLAKNGNQVTAISKYALDAKAYNNSKTSVTWETCTLRSWLNNDFYSTAFNNSEKKVITETVRESEDIYNINGGNPTKDNVWLLSRSEANDYFSNDAVRKCEPTRLAKNNGALVSYGCCDWWLSTPGGFIADSSLASYVTLSGFVNSGGYSVDDSGLCVRPALTISI